MVYMSGEVEREESGRTIRRAEPEEHLTLTGISFRSKAYWRYPPSYFSRWVAELTLTRQYIRDNMVYSCATSEEIIGYYAVVVLSKEKELFGRTLHRGWWLDHMFVAPEHIGTGAGREMFSHCLAQLQAAGAAKLMILADPFARNFYEKMGCIRLDAYPSTIPGRPTPYLEYQLAG